MIEEAVYTRLSGYAGLSALVSTRIYPAGEVPQGAVKPYVTYQLISSPRNSVMSRDTVTRPRFQITAWADDYLDAKNVKEQVRLALQRFSGTVSGMVIQAVFIISEYDTFDEESRVNGIVQDFEINYEGA